MSRNFLSTNDELRKGDFLISNNQQYKAIFQEDGNFVIYGWRPIWSSKTDGNQEAHRLVMQQDCNFVMYTKGDKPCWSTSSYNACEDCRCRVFLRDDGVLEVDRNGEKKWTSH
ncbi:LOW QUALITY PROTEIN: mannose-specific lectin-like [Alosa alosa]|uniref:mannose-specific lectin-like n=1 Tax=Alosa sapidissima TaxID=34773 RepID=UPI001C08EDB6|nr:mannose-specific lectin-like [Alosa sapidissima]XP_048106857.1 LOW QUALITY PROTEIN: mannose-specific lectin-like [Alosa alosa]